MSLEQLSANRSFGGTQHVYRHASSETGTDMRFGVYLPEQSASAKVPVVFWLSGLTCTEENFIVKAGAQRMASALGIAIVVPDTSPRGLGYPGEDDAYDFGTGAGFYVDATVEPWSRGYRMASYVADELPRIVGSAFPVDMSRCGIFGHSMGGHGAISLAIKHPDKFRSVSAFAPICAPTQCSWGQKLLGGYLGDDQSTWQDYDSCALIRRHGWTGPSILVDQGLDDEFMAGQLLPEQLEAACRDAGVALTLNRRVGYDHSYFFIASFIDEHLRHHAEALKA